QQATARGDPPQMIRDHVLPDQIHNYAHNNQWLVTDLIYIGRAHDAVDLAKNMIELPRHPKYNNYGVGGSAPQGRERLLDALTAFELWDDLIALADTVYLEPTEMDAQKIQRLSALGLAWFSKGNLEKGALQISELE